MQKEFKLWLVSQGLKEFTDNGTPSTVNDYVGRINRICISENCKWNELANRINKILQEYEKDGEKSSLGKRSHDSVLNALRWFCKFTLSNLKEKTNE